MSSSKDFVNKEFDTYIPGKIRRQISIMFHVNGTKLQAVKDLMDVKKAIPELSGYGLRECKEYVESLPSLKEDPVLDILDKIEEIEKMVRDFPDLIVESMPNLTIEQAIELVKLPENFLGELKRRATVASSGNRFGI